MRFRTQAWSECRVAARRPRAWGSSPAAPVVVDTSCCVTPVGYQSATPPHPWTRSPRSSVHGTCASASTPGAPLLARARLYAFGERFVHPESPIDVAPEDNPTNEPEPDLIVLNRDLSNFSSANPRPQDLHLVVEVSDTTLNFDLTIKTALYARAGIVEYWVLDVSGRRLIVHRDPQS